MVLQEGSLPRLAWDGISELRNRGRELLPLLEGWHEISEERARELQRAFVAWQLVLSQDLGYSLPADPPAARPTQSAGPP